MNALWYFKASSFKLQGLGYLTTGPFRLSGCLSGGKAEHWVPAVVWTSPPDRGS
ncbi:hypothetical protein BC834DRAFT_850454 [Gloeopeniophorella convolvens]|nr:hypothetical protein BC834DRAFT_850454 [Gloeopeniophorella convolvens]